MTATLTTAHNRTRTPPSVDVIRAATRRLLTTISALDADDDRWHTIGPLLGAAAQRLREALGSSITGSCTGAPPIVQERDLSTAAHRLLARDVRIENEQAARQFLRLALDATVALS
jgi:hypothetical protein